MKNNIDKSIEENVELAKLKRFCLWNSTFNNLLSEWLPTLTIKPNQKELQAKKSIAAIISTKRQRIIPEICDSCEGKGYIEVTHEDNCEYIEACQECGAFTEGSMGDCTNADQNARDKAVKEGYKLNKQGKIIL